MASEFKNLHLDLSTSISTFYYITKSYETISRVLLGIIPLCFSLLLFRYLRLRLVKQEKRQNHLAFARKALADEGRGDLLPDPDPLLDFDLETATTRNYLYVNKPLRFPYHQTMAHQPMHINHWIEITKDYKWHIDYKSQVIEEQGKHVIDSFPDNDAGCAELLEVLVDYLPKRYPTLFENINCKGGGIWNKVTDERITGLEARTGVDALRVVSRLVEDDFLMGREREDGQIYWTGGLVGFPGFFLLSEGIGKTVEAIHKPVPHFKEKMLLSIQRTLKRFKPNEPFERSSWSITDDRKLFRHNMSIASKLGTKLPEKLQAKDLFLRIDHQTFCKLPKTRAIIFGIHATMKRLEELADSPLVPALLVKVHEESEKILMDYKLAPFYRNLMIPYLREMTAKQIESGLICGGEDASKFRELIRAADGQSYPNPLTSMTKPTESELDIGNSEL